MRTPDQSKDAIREQAPWPQGLACRFWGPKVDGQVLGITPVRTLNPKP